MYADLAFFIIIVLFALLGLWKGFFKTLISFCGWFASFLIAFFLTKPIVRALLDIGAVQNFVVGNGKGWSLYNWFISWLPSTDMTDGGIFGVLISPFIKLASSVGSNPTESVALMLSNGVFSVMVCFGLLIVVRLLMILATMYANAAAKGKLAGALNRLLGFATGAVKGFGIIVIIMAIMSFIMSMNFMAPVREQFDKSVVAGPVYTQVVKVTDKVVSGGKERLKLLLRFRKNTNTGEEGGGEEEKNPDYVGEYKVTTTAGDETFTYILTLNKDKTCSYGEEKGTPRTGTYTIDGSVLKVTFNPVAEGGEPEIFEGVYHSEGWIEFDGDYLSKEGVTPPEKPTDPFSAGTYKSEDGKITLVLTGDEYGGECVLTIEGEDGAVTSYDGAYGYYEGVLTLTIADSADYTVTDGVIDYGGTKLTKVPETSEVTE